MSWASIVHAHAYWRDHWNRIDPPSNLEQAETFILNEPPHTTEDATCILDVVCAYYGDARCDGLDHAALARIRSFLSLPSRTDVLPLAN